MVVANVVDLENVLSMPPLCASERAGTYMLAELDRRHHPDDPDGHVAKVAHFGTDVRMHDIAGSVEVVPDQIRV